jgi:hypothetical protein
MEEIAQSVGDEKIHGEFDWDSVNIQAGHDGQVTDSSLVGAVLARRFKILKKIDAESFKAHDLTLDQTVTVRQVLRTAPRDGDVWRQKMRQLALVRDPNFLNILDVIFGESSDYVVTESPPGHSIGDFLRERSRFDLKEVLRLVIPLTGSLERAAGFSWGPNPVSGCWWFTETRSSSALDLEPLLPSDWPTFCVKLDIWELVRPRKKTWPVLLKVPGGGVRRMAVRQAALLTYELLGGEKKKEGQVKRWFRPVNEVSSAVNDILYAGLQGSPLFETCESFFLRLESANPPGEGEVRALSAPGSQTLEHSGNLPNTNEVIRRFNRETVLLATLVVGAVVSAALMLGVLVQDRHGKGADSPEETVQVGGDRVLIATSTTAVKDAGLKEKNSAGEITPGPASKDDRPVAQIAPQETPSLRMASVASSPTPALAVTPEIDHNNAQSNASAGSPANWQGNAREMGTKVRNLRYRALVVHRYFGVRRRLLALWHQSLRRSEKSRSWTAFSNLKRGTSKKAAYTAQMNHTP